MAASPEPRHERRGTPRDASEIAAAPEAAQEGRAVATQARQADVRRQAGRRARGATAAGGDRRRRPPVQAVVVAREGAQGMSRCAAAAGEILANEADEVLAKGGAAVVRGERARRPATLGPGAPGAETAIGGHAAARRLRRRDQEPAQVEPSVEEEGAKLAQIPSVQPGSGNGPVAGEDGGVPADELSVGVVQAFTLEGHVRDDPVAEEFVAVALQDECAGQRREEADLRLQVVEPQRVDEGADRVPEVLAGLLGKTGDEGHRRRDPPPADATEPIAGRLEVEALSDPPLNRRRAALHPAEDAGAAGLPHEVDEVVVEGVGPGAARPGEPLPAGGDGLAERDDATPVHREVVVD